MNDQKQKKIEHAVNIAFSNLGCAIFQQAVYDCRNPELEQHEQASAMDWLIDYGFEYLTDMLSIEISAGDYMNFIARIQEADTPIMFVGRQPEPNKQKVTNPLKGLSRTRAQKTDNRHWKKIKFNLGKETS